MLFGYCAWFLWFAQKVQKTQFLVIKYTEVRREDEISMKWKKDDKRENSAPNWCLKVATMVER
jgi:hypothetical protein